MQKLLDLIERIQNKRASIGVVGVGYVGSSLGAAAGETGYDTRGYDISTKAVQRVNARNVPGFTAYDNARAIEDCDVIAICVPTPVKGDRSPDLGPLMGALETVKKILKNGQLILVESSIAPGTTREVILPVLESEGIRVEEDFFLAYSPERIDPGNGQFHFANIPKVVAGIGERSGMLAYAFYNNIVSSVRLVSSIETAELTKLFENTFRLVNISLVNELSSYTKKIGVDIFEVIEAAATKPFGFLPHYPGPGVGGHCIPVDPYYLVHAASQKGVKLGIVSEAGKVNSLQPRRVASEALRVVSLTNGKKKNHRILLIGASYKENVDDTRESASEVIMHLLEKEKVAVDFHDPYIDEFMGKKSVKLGASLTKYDLIIIVVAHKGVDYNKLASLGIPILDTKDIYHDFSLPHVYSFFSKSVTKRNKKIKSSLTAKV